MSSFKIKNLNLRRDKLLLSSVAIVLSLHFAFGLTFFAKACEGVRNDVVRLHILANSDSKKDQEVKLKVRNALLQKNTSLLSDNVNTENAHIYFNQSKEELLETAKNVLMKNGFSYDAKITLEKEYFETRKYGELTFPAGEYLSLKVILGEGAGHNWWCVMFPPLCIPVSSEIETDESKTADHLSPNGEEIINGGNEYIIKFKIIEVFEELKSKL